ncbi:hypothetical protein BN946_scf184648.g2 [Trametes cinnabarina]|uniref:Retrotransposon gag domain-containing protein n=1 Tax=Pycnoporus cinnabarinus TaxID=5643 RepID=A0A060SUF8_PYCCI|nr:hypothetical protein BN946_scf184648.g2 [Trametes cinnabarina]
MIPPANPNYQAEHPTEMVDLQPGNASDAESTHPAAPVILTPATNGGGDFVNDARLKPVSGRFEMIPPEDDDHSTAERVDRSLAFMACGDSSETMRSEVLRERVFTALAYGHKYLDRPHLSIPGLRQLDEHQRDRIFPIEMGKLDAILLRPWKVRPNKEGYWPDYGDLEELRDMLEARRYAAESDFRQLRKSPPSIPFWGRDTAASGYVHSLNDFEILGICFRREVEYYLARLAEVHRFDEEPFWDNGPSFLGPAGTALTTGTPHPSRKERRAARKEETRTPISSPPPPPVAPKKPLRDAPPHFKGRYAGEDAQPAGQGTTPYDVGDDVWAGQDGRIPSRPARVKEEEGRIGGGFAPANGMTGLFRRTVSPTRVPPRGFSSPPNDPSDSEPSDEDDSPGRGGGRIPPRRDDSRHDESRKGNRKTGRGAPGGAPPGGGSSRGSVAAGRRGTPQTHEAHFDFKLKMEIMPTWDGNPDKLARWILRVNSIAKKSATVRQQLGSVVPQRLTGDAETWYFSLPEHVREDCETDWEEIRQEIGRYYMNWSWYEKARRQALAIKFRDSDNTRESPSQYFIRKRELLELVFSYTESELITEIMAGAPLAWKTILAFKSYQTTSELQSAIKAHEDDLLQMESFIGGRLGSQSQFSRDPRPGTSHTPYRARANQGLTGQSRYMPPPPFPKDDSNVDKKTPESINARPCRHCGSGKHWDPSCKYARKGMKKVRAHLASGLVEADEIAAQEEYESLYYDVLTDSDSDDHESDF